MIVATTVLSELKSHIASLLKPDPFINGQNLTRDCIKTYQDAIVLSCDIESCWQSLRLLLSFARFYAA